MYKTRARADLLRGLADNQGLANSLAEYQTRYGDWRELFLQLDQVDKVTKADIRRVANQIFVASNRTSAEIDTRSRRRGAKNGGAAMSSLRAGTREQRPVRYRGSFSVSIRWQCDRRAAIVVGNRSQLA